MEARLQQCIHIEECKDSNLWVGPLASKVMELKDALHENWSTKSRQALVTKCLENQRDQLSEREYILFQWMCIHVTLGGTSTTNPKSGNVFDYIHYALNYNSDFVLDIIQGTGLTGLYSVSGYTVSDPRLDTWTDEYLAYIYEQLPIPESLYVRKKDDLQKNLKAIVRCVGVMMNQLQLRHIDMPTALGLIHNSGEPGACSGTCIREIMS